MKRGLLFKKACTIALLLSCGSAGFAQLSGTVNVGAGQTYTSLTGAGGLFENINAQGMSGDLTAVITSDLTEAGTVTLNDFTSAGTNNYHLAIVPDGTTVRSITNTGSPAAMVKFSGVSNLKIDGSVNGSGRYLRFSSAIATTTAYTIQLAGTSTLACSNDTIKNCIIEGANINSSTSGAGGMIGLIATGSAKGVTNTAILNNLISSPGTYNNTASTMAGTGIISVTGTTAVTTNSNITIDNNEFANCQWIGIVQATSANNTSPDNFTITNNSFYFTIAAATSTTVRYSIYVRDGQNHTVANNWIGGSAPLTSGSAMSFTGSATTSTIYCIYLPATATSVVNIYGNTIANITFPSTSSVIASGFNGIYLANGALGNIYNNTIRQITATGSSAVCGIYSASPNTRITGNTIGGSNTGDNLTTAGTLVAGIYASGDKDTISGNIIKNLVSTGINSSATDAVGIYSTGRSPYIYNNTIDSIIGNNTSNSGNQAVLGMNVSSGVTGGTPSIVAKNTITNIINTNTSGTTAYANSVSGISVIVGTTAAPIKFEGNYISRIYGFNATAGNNITGILENNNAAGGNDTFVNNVIVIDTARVTNGWIKCVHVSANATNANFYNNTFVIGSSLALTANNNSGKGGAHCLTTNSGSVKLNLYNNILTNQSATTGTAQPFAFMNLTTVASSSANMISNYNLVYTNDTSKIFGAGTTTITNYNLSSWRTTITGDTSTTVGLAPFNSLTDFHINTADPKAWNVFGRGMANTLAGTDKDGNVRSTTLGIPTTIGAYEIATPTTAPAVMTMTPAIPVTGTPTVFSSNGRKIAEINWDAAATLPSSINATFYPGVPAPGSPNISNVNSYVDIQQAGFSGNYTIKLYTNPAEANGIAYTAMGAIKKHDGDANYTVIANAGSNSTDADGNYILSNTLSNFSIFGLTNPSTPLPVIWNKVSATLNRRQQADIIWTVSEKEVRHYIVQKSTDGIQFNDIATVGSKGNGNNSYAYTESSRLNGKAWYRIAQISVNGKVDYSTVMMLQNSAIYGKVNIYPNPATQVLNVEVDQANVPYSIFDLQGKMIARGLLQQGKNTVDVMSLAKGFYTVKIGDTNQKIVIQ